MEEGGGRPENSMLVEMKNTLDFDQMFKFLVFGLIFILFYFFYVQSKTFSNNKPTY